MKVPVNDLRKFTVMPSKLVTELSLKKVTGYSIIRSDPNNKWYQNDFNIHFGEPDVDGAKLDAICRDCKGVCCTNLLEHQIRIFMTEPEAERIKDKFPLKFDGQAVVDGEKVNVISVKENGDCAYLTETGCPLGEERPLWCKMFYCEKAFGGKYGMEEK